MGLVKGFTDVLCPPNLATNGQFWINQRGTFQDYLAFDAKTEAARAYLGAFASDAWRIAVLDFNSCYLNNFLMPDWGSASIDIRGSGKKGQVIALGGMEHLNVIGGVYPPHLNSYTSAVDGYNVAGVPVELSCTPRGTYNTSFPYSHMPKLKSGQRGTAVQIAQFTNGNNSYHNDAIYVRLLADGEFDVSITNFRVMQGAYANPPAVAHPCYADDLLRCKRYFQKGTMEVFGVGYTTDTQYGLASRLQFEVEMAGNPSMTFKDGPNEVLVIEEGVTGIENNARASYDVNVNYSNKLGAFFSAQKAIGGSKPRQFSILEWTATV